MTDELKPCPFCGGKAGVTSGPCAWNAGGIAWNVTCPSYGCHGGIFALGVDMFASPAKAIAAWNRRFPDPQLAAERARADALADVLEAVWKHATFMRSGTEKVVGPYPNHVEHHRVWKRSLYHEGKRIMELIKPVRKARENNDGQ